MNQRPPLHLVAGCGKDYVPKTKEELFWEELAKFFGTKTKEETIKRSIAVNNAAARHRNNTNNK